MKKLISLFTILFLFISGIIAQDLDEILDTYFETIGQEKLIEYNTMMAKGKSIQQGMETAFSLWQKRPDSFCIEVDIQGATMTQVYDGENGWYIAPWSGSLDPVDLDGFQLKALKRESDFDGMLYNYEEKGYQAELVGTEDMEGTEVFKIKQSDEEGNIFYHFIDSENFVMLKTSAIVKVGDSEVEADTYFSNYKEQDGMIVPFSIESRSNGQTARQVNIEEIVFDLDIDDSKFIKPEKTEPEQKEAEPKDKGKIEKE